MMNGKNIIKKFYWKTLLILIITGILVQTVQHYSYAQASKAVQDEYMTQKIIDPETGKDITSQYIAEKLRALEKIADNIINNAVSEFKKNADKKQTIYDDAWREIHVKLGMGSIGPATAAAAPLMREKKKRLAELLEMDMDKDNQILLPFEKGGRFGYKNKQGTVVIKAAFHAAQEFLPGGIAAVLDDRGWVYIDKRGNAVVRPFIYDNGPDYFQGGLARFIVDQKFGFFNESGRIIIPASFDFTFPFSEGLAAACMECRIQSQGEHSMPEGGKWGYINHRGEWSILPTFQNASSFSEGKARVGMHGKCYYIDNQGKVLSACTGNPETKTVPTERSNKTKN